MDLEAFLRQVAAKEYYEVRAHGADEGEIRALEASLAISLPSTYRRLLSLVGFVGWFGNEIFGITGDKENDTFLRTKAEREHALQFRDKHLFQLPRYGNVIGEMFGGGYSFLYSVESSRAGQVSAHAPDERYEEVQYWNSVEDYFEYLLSKPKVLKNWHVRGNRS